MTYICAWCGDSLPDYQNDGSERVSHGICEPCALRLLPVELHSEYHRRKELEGQA